MTPGSLCWEFLGDAGVCCGFASLALPSAGCPWLAESSVPVRTLSEVLGSLGSCKPLWLFAGDLPWESSPGYLFKIIEFF